MQRRVHENNQIIAQLLVHISARFGGKNIKNKVLQHLPSLKKNKCNWSFGPIIFDSKNSSNVFAALKKYLQSMRILLFIDLLVQKK